MQSQKEQQSKNLKSIPYHDEYAWLNTLNLVAIAIFGLAFLYFEDEVRWLCAIAVFFCFIFIFVLQALRDQHRKIYLQQHQIDQLLKNQTVFLTQQHQQNADLFETVEQSDTTMQAYNVNRINHIDEQQIVTEKTESLNEPTQDRDSINSPLNDHYSEINSNFENQQIHQTESALYKTSIQGVEESIQQQNVQQPQQSHSADQSQVTQKDQDNVLLKDLKGMTSLWRAFVEWFKGGNSIVRIAIIILLIGVILLLRFASEYWQPTLSTKMVGIAVAGVVMTAIGYRLRHKRYGYAISVQGAGLGVLFLVLFSAFKLSIMTSIVLSYGLLIVLLGITLLLALRQNALILAFIALGCGFVAPFILNTGSSNIPALFTYYLALNAALAVIAFFKPWRILNTISLLATFGVGGLSIWMNAQPDQYTMLMILVWLHFALYLFISIRYSLNISQYKIAFKNIPLIDTGLIFATPFMAFTLYAGLVFQNQSYLSLASTLLAFVYLSIGYVLHKKYQSLTLLIQSFYGLGLTFLALVLPFAFNAQWTSTGWAVQALALIWIGCRHRLKNSLLFGLALLGLSTLSWLKSIFVDANINLLTITFLCSALMMSLYIFNTPQLNESVPTSDDDENESFNIVSQRNLSSILTSVVDTAKVMSFITLQVIIIVYSTKLYGLNQLNENAILMSILTLVAAVMAWRIHQVQHQISLAVQLFMGCSLFYFAMIPLMLWQADLVALWWMAQAFVMVVMTSRYAIVHIRNFASILLVASAITTLIAILNQDNLRYFAVALLICVFAVSAYWLRYQVQSSSTIEDKVFTVVHLIASFLFVPYLTYKLVDVINWDLNSIVLPMLLWWGILTVIYWLKQAVLDRLWLYLTVVLLLLSATEIAAISSFAVNQFNLWNMTSKYHVSMLSTIILWAIAFIFILKKFTSQLNRTLAQILMFIAVLLMAAFGGLIAWNEFTFIPLVLLFPVGILFASLKIKSLQFLQGYWVRNIALVALGLVSLWAMSLYHDGNWNLPYLTLLNPIDLFSIGIFILIISAVKSFFDEQSRELQIGGTAILILTGLMLISSIMLRSLHQYLQLPYWSVEAWRNGTVQASLTILWVILALVLTTFSSQKALRHVWMLGIAVLALVIAKLIFLDLSHTHTITRIISFIGSGLVMLIIGYFAPLPPAQKDSNLES